MRKFKIHSTQNPYRRKFEEEEKADFANEIAMLEKVNKNILNVALFSDQQDRLIALNSNAFHVFKLTLDEMLLINVIKIDFYPRVMRSIPLISGSFIDRIVLEQFYQENKNH